VDTVRIDEQFNASFATVGWRRRRELTIGLPLWSVLEPDEQVALLGHELGHCVTGDPLRGVYVGAAVSTLSQWCDLLRPRRAMRRRRDLVSVLIEPVVNLVMFCLAQLPRTAAAILVQGAWRESQRAEYRADLVGASVSGADAQVSLLRKLGLRGTVARCVQHAALARTRDDLFVAVRAAAHAVPATELERLRRISCRPGVRVDRTHPPTAYRIALMERVSNRPAVEQSTSDVAAIETELAPLRSALQHKLVDGYRNRLTRG
jgi:Zn-dependent protease with chaperone function